MGCDIHCALERRDDSPPPLLSRYSPGPRELRRHRRRQGLPEEPARWVRVRAAFPTPYNLDFVPVEGEPDEDGEVPTMMFERENADSPWEPRVRTLGYVEGVPGSEPKPLREPGMTDEPYDGRNYRLFAVLADVRNGRGFGGMDTGNEFVAIVPGYDEPAEAE